MCSGNRCRSPYAHIVTDRLAPEWIQVSSAGTLDIPGVEPPQKLIETASSRGVDLSTFTSRYLTQADPQRADLVFGMALQHVATSVVDAGVAPEKAFRLTEFVLFLESLQSKPASSPDEARALVKKAHELRKDHTFTPSGDIEDPIGGPRLAYIAMAEKLDDLCARLAQGLWRA